MSELRVLQFGETGQVAREMIAAAQNAGVSLTTISRNEGDFCRPDHLVRSIAEADVDFVVNTVAYTAVDKAESEPELAQTVNADSVAAIAKTCATRNLPFIHLSTDYVFDGQKPEPYLETDGTNPLSIYGKTKLAGERYIQEASNAHIIIRTSWVYSPYGNNFLKTMLRLGAERDNLRVVADQYGAPTAALDIAQTILSIVRQQGNGSVTDAFGIFHFAAAGTTTWYDFANSIAEEARAFRQFKARIEPIPATAYPTAARRPYNSRLDCNKIASVYGIEPDAWQSSLAKTFNFIKADQGTNAT